LEEKKSTILEYALEKSPYYQNNFSEGAPITVTKDNLREHYNEFVAEGSDLIPQIVKYTSGSTGKPLKIAMPKTQDLFNDACVWRGWNWVGVKWGTRQAWLEPFFKKSCYEEPMRRYGDLRLYLNSKLMDVPKMYSYLCWLTVFQPEAFHSIPSALYVFTCFAETTKIKIPKMKAILLQCETLTPERRKYFEDFYGCYVGEWYGHNETAISASTCEEGGFHINWEMGFPTIIGGYIHATSFLNKIIPLINYRTNDQAEIIWGRCKCGRESPRYKYIKGKMRDPIIRPDKTFVGGEFLTTDYMTFKLWVKQFKFEQTALDHVVISIVTDDEKQIPAFKKELQEIFKNMTVEVNTVPAFNPDNFIIKSVVKPEEVF